MMVEIDTLIYVSIRWKYLLHESLKQQPKTGTRGTRDYSLDTVSYWWVFLPLYFPPSLLSQKIQIDRSGRGGPVGERGKEG